MTSRPAHAIERGDDPNETINAMLDLAEGSVRTAIDAGGERARLALAERFGRMGLVDVPAVSREPDPHCQFNAIELANLLGVLKSCSRLARGEAALEQLRWARNLITADLNRRQRGQHACTTGKCDDGANGIGHDCDRARSRHDGDIQTHRGDQPVPATPAQQGVRGGVA